MPSSVLRCTNYQATFVLISVMGVIFCFIPLILLYSHYDRGYTTENIKYTGRDYHHSSLSVSFYVAIIPLIDLLIDFYQHRWQWFKEKIPDKEIGESNVYRLTDKEKFTFIIGMILQGIVYFIPTKDYGTMIGVYDCTNKASSILLVAPLLYYLKRCTTTFTPLVTVIILIFLVSGLIMSSTKNFFRFDLPIYYRMCQSEKILIGSAAALFLVTGISSFYLFCIPKNTAYCNRRFCRNSCMASIYDLLKVVKPKDILHTSDVGLVYTHYVPALQMIASIIIGVGNMLRSNVIGNSLSLSSCFYIVLIGEVMVLVIELRIRKNEIARGLVRLFKDSSCMHHEFPSSVFERIFFIYLQFCFVYMHN